MSTPVKHLSSKSSDEILVNSDSQDNAVVLAFDSARECKSSLLDLVEECMDEQELEASLALIESLDEFLGEGR